MRSRLWRILLWLSLAVLLIAVMLWVRGVYVRDRIDTVLIGRKVRIESFPHHLFLVYGVANGPTERSYFEFAFQMMQFEGKAEFWEVRYRRMRGGFVGIGIPYWLVILLASTLPIYWLHLKLTRRSRRRQGMCASCGYDLRASTDRCPECGEPISTSSPVAPAS